MTKFLPVLKSDEISLLTSTWVEFEDSWSFPQKNDKTMTQTHVVYWCPSWSFNSFFNIFMCGTLLIQGFWGQIIGFVDLCTWNLYRKEKMGRNRWKMAYSLRTSKNIQIFAITQRTKEKGVKKKVRKIRRKRGQKERKIRNGEGNKKEKREKGDWKEEMKRSRREIKEERRKEDREKSEREWRRIRKYVFLNNEVPLRRERPSTEENVVGMSSVWIDFLSVYRHLENQSKHIVDVVTQ